MSIKTPIQWSDSTCNPTLGCDGYFLTQLGMHVRERSDRLRLDDRHGGTWDDWPRRLRVRQMPVLTSRKASQAGKKSVVVA